VPAAGPDPFGFCIIVGGGDEEVSEQLGGRRGVENSVVSVDVWR